MDIKGLVFAMLLVVLPLGSRADQGMGRDPSWQPAAQEAPGASGTERASTAYSVPLAQLVDEAIRNNPEIASSARERDAAQQRVPPAGALDDPMLEAGVVNLPVESWSFRREDMTMKMIGLAQRFPYPGKRGLRQDAAAREAASADYNYLEAVNRVIRDVKVAYFDLALTLESTRLVEKNKLILEQFLKVAEARYTVGQGNQADVLKAQTQVSKMADELVKLDRERATIEAELNRTLGRRPGTPPPRPELPPLREVALQPDALREAALTERPQLLALQNTIARSEKMLELARKDYYPDFDVRLSYGQRDPTPEGERREDMISLTVAMNLPVWRQNKLDPRVAEAAAMREQALSMYQAQQNELAMKLRQQLANAEQSLRSARLYGTGILPQARLAVESSLAAYKVNRVDFFTLLDNQMTVFNYDINYASVVASYYKALAEIELVTGKPIRVADR